MDAGRRSHLILALGHSTQSWCWLWFDPGLGAGASMLPLLPINLPKNKFNILFKYSWGGILEFSGFAHFSVQRIRSNTQQARLILRRSFCFLLVYTTGVCFVLFFYLATIRFYLCWTCELCNNDQSVSLCNMPQLNEFHSTYAVQSFCQSYYSSLRSH